MVVRVPDSFGDFFTRGNVKIPCQCYYNARDNILTEILQHPYNQIHKSEHTSNFETQRKHKNAPEKKNVETETFPEPCCVCEYYRNLEKSKNKKDLWNMQFNRWWGWNWQRKRKDFLSKFKSKEQDCICSARSKHQTFNLNKNKCDSHSICRIHQESSRNCKTESFISPQIHENPSNIPEVAETLHPIPPITTYSFKKPYTGRRRRNKHKQRLYEGWIREISSSESDNSVKSVKLRMARPKISTNNKEYMHYLSLRMRKFNSDESLDEDKKIEDEDDKPESEIKPDAIPADSKYFSPISGKYYNLNLTQFSNPFSEINDTEYLQPIDFKDEQIIPKPEYDWIKHYNMMKDEHSELLKSIGEVLCTSKMQNLQSEKEIRNLYYSNSKTTELKSTLICNNNCVEEQENKIEESMKIYSNSKPLEIKSTLICNNCVEEQENKVKEPIQINDLPNPCLNFQHRSEIIISPTNPFYENTLVKSLTNNCSKSINLPNYKPVQPLLISKSSNLFYQDALEHNSFQPKENTNKKMGEVEEQTVVCDVKNVNYDINYISNNLQSFSSTISDTEFLICRTEISSTDVTEDMSETILQEIDLCKE